MRDVTKIYSRADVRARATRDDAWVIVDGNVYDVTSWIPKHPGGDGLLLAFAGRDCTDEFAAFHRPEIRKKLDAFLVGKVDPKNDDSDDSDESNKRDRRDRRDHREGLSRLREDLRERGAFDVDGSYLALCLFRLAAFLGVATLLARANATVVGAAFLGLFQQQCLLLAHDFLHGSAIGGRDLSFWCGWAVGTVAGGVGAAWWRRDHFAHHALTNVLDHDPSAGAEPFVFISHRQFERKPRARWERWLLRAQTSAYFPLCVFFGRLNLHLVSVLVSPRPLVDGVGVLLYLAWNVAFLSPRAWFASHVVCSVLHLQLNVGHYPAPMTTKDEMHDAGFLAHQAKTTVNVSCSRWTHWFHGGLEYQIEHHLFPLLPRHRLGLAAEGAKSLLSTRGLSRVEYGFARGNAECVRALAETTASVASSSKIR